jgi:hypothetical protein
VIVRAVILDRELEVLHEGCERAKGQAWILKRDARAIVMITLFADAAIRVTLRFSGPQLFPEAPSTGFDRRNSVLTERTHRSLI